MKEEICEGNLLAAVGALLLLPVLFVLLLPSLIFGGLADSGNGQPILNNNIAIQEAMSNIAFAVSRILSEGVADVRNRIAEDFAKSDADGYEIVNPYEDETVANTNAFIAQYCAAKEKDWRGIRQADMEALLRRNLKKLYSYTVSSETSSVADDPETSEDESKSIRWRVYTIHYNGERYFADAVFQLTEAQKALADNYEQNLNLFLCNGIFPGTFSTDAEAVLHLLPVDLPQERRAVVEAACSLVGKVDYFWGGKSYVLGWDSRWGKICKVTSEGSETTGTYRPYGLDCSGFADWVFYQTSDGTYILGHGGGAAKQHSFCTDIPWEEAQPGDLVFYSDDSHVGIVGGRDGEGRLLIIHCTSGYDNVVVTGADRFFVAARPFYYEE